MKCCFICVIQVTTFAELMNSDDIAALSENLTINLPNCEVQTIFLKDFTREAQLTDELR